jgi:hypothetical protein
MSMNFFRTHTRLPPRLWADIGDEHGTMFLAEFPVLFNYQDYKFTPGEWEIWHRNCLLDAVGWMARLWNHPSVIMWVLSNESRLDNAWEGCAAPQSAAWHSALSPVLASLDLFDPNYRTGQEVTTDLHLINDSWHEAQVHVELVLTRENPEFIPQAQCFDQPLSTWDFAFTLAADSIRTVPVTWKLPEAEGCYWLTARTTGVEGRPVLSQRCVRAFNPPVVPNAAKERTFVLLGASDASRGFFGRWGLRLSDHLDDLSSQTHTVVIWNATRLIADEKRSARALCDFAGRGGPMIVLAAPSWDWSELCEVRLSREPRFSRVFRHRESAGSLLAGLDSQWPIRWNGFPGTVASGALQGAVMDRAQKVFWAREPTTTVMAFIPAASGNGRILFSQLDLQRRVDSASPDYDPAAEHILLSLLGI